MWIKKTLFKLGKWFRIQITSIEIAMDLNVDNFSSKKDCKARSECHQLREFWDPDATPELNWILYWHPLVLGI